MRTIPVILFGIGGVGRSLIRQIVELRRWHAAEYGFALSFSAICDSNGAVLAMDGELDDALLLELVELKEAAGRLADHELGGPQGDSYSIVDIAGRSGALVVDCSASDTTTPGLLYALEKSYRVVLANKKPLTGDQEVYDLFASAGSSGKGNAAKRSLSGARWEATVGAGLPVNAMLSRLVSSGDTVERITGALSGTLGYVMNGLQQGLAFSEIVNDAYQQGYTEPDPRDDLSGIDVARKALILGRGLGWKLDLEDIEVEGLYPKRMDSLSVSEFLEELPDLDEPYRAQVQRAQEQGSVLRYAATVADGECSAGPVIAEEDSPLGKLRGTDNLVEFRSRWYNPNPLVIQGRGAGVEVTAAGVLSDMIELASAD